MSATGSLHAESFVKQSLPRQESIGLLVAAVRRRLKQVVAAAAAGYRLSPQQFWTVVMVARDPGLSLGALAARRRMDDPTACRVVDTLVRRRLVRKAPDPSDQRRLRLALTPSGEALAASLLPLASEIGRAAEAGLTRTERDATLAVLRKVLRNLDRFDAARAARESSPEREEEARREAR